MVSTQRNLLRPGMGLNVACRLSLNQSSQSNSVNSAHLAFLRLLAHGNLTEHFQIRSEDEKWKKLGKSPIWGENAVTMAKATAGLMAPMNKESPDREQERAD
jgi:hypothetical protein